MSYLDYKEYVSKLGNKFYKINLQIRGIQCSTFYDFLHELIQISSFSP